MSSQTELVLRLDVLVERVDSYFEDLPTGLDSRGVYLLFAVLSSFETRAARAFVRREMSRRIGLLKLLRQSMKDFDASTLGRSDRAAHFLALHIELDAQQLLVDLLKCHLGVF